MTESEKVMSDLFRSHSRALNGFARRRVGGQEAEDVVQDAYLHLLQHDKIEALERPRAYLFRVASNLATDVRRRTKTRSRYVIDDVELDGLGPAVASLDTSAESLMESIRLQGCLARLPPLCRTIFLLNRMDGLSYSEIAARLRISLRTVNRQMARASNFLHKHIDGDRR